MLHIHHSNRAEDLLAGLMQRLAEPPQGALTPELVVTASQGMGRWVALQLAERTGVAANLEFVLPAAFVWRVLQAQLDAPPSGPVLDRETLLWRCMAVLPDWVETPGFETLRGYLEGRDRPLKLYQLSRRIADVFDRYSVYRPDWLHAWERGGASEDPWQAPLWRALAEGRTHRGHLLQRYADRKRAAGLGSKGLPSRVSVFGLSALAPAYLDVLAAVAERADVQVFVLNPCTAYWGDIVTPRTRARVQERQGDLFASYMEVGNPLLASWGGLGRAFLEQLHDYAGEEHEHFVAPAGGTLLPTLQRDILALTTPAPGERRLAEADDTLRVHVCHSPLREVEVLHDRLLALFEALPGLTPRDVVVMTPDVALYAPYVEAVFGNAPPPRHIPWSLADRGPRELHPLVAVALELLTLPSWRFEAGRVAELLETPSLLRRFGLAERDLPLLHQWVRDSGVRHGLDGAQRAAAGLPAEEANTWAFGLRRLFLGYAMPEASAALVQGVLPCAGIEGGEAEALGRLQTLVARLQSFATRFAQPLAPVAWQETVNALLDGFFEAEEEDEAAAVQAVRDALDAWVKQTTGAGYELPVTVEVLREHLERQLATPAGPGGFLSGGVTFCTLVPMRAVPFRVVCLLGLDDEAYPRRARPPSFDLMAETPRRGDPSPREEDRYLFLEALLSAREHLHLSYVGRDARDNSERPPSVLVSELLDYVAVGWGKDARTCLVSEHPLQPFSTRCYGDGAPPVSYAEEWLPAAQALARGPTEPPPRMSSSLPEPALAEVDLEALVALFRNPARAFLEQRLGVRLPREEAALEDAEPFAVGGLDGYGLRRDLVEAFLRDEPAEALAERMHAAGRLPSGAFGAVEFETLARVARAQAEVLRPLLPAMPQRVELDLTLDGVRLTGWLTGIGAHGLVLYRSGKLRAQDRLELWLRHLALNAAGVADASFYVGREETLSLETCTDAQAVLAGLLALYREGLSAPLPFEPEAALAALETLRKGDKSPQDARRAAALKSARNGMDTRDAWRRLLWGERDLVDAARFLELAETVCGRLLDAQHLEGHDAPA
ncbi:exodeoxyribonuclease V subunit gamma [Ectothiorhodospiraceae bacterium 2226]|nr:exodeoxyribonuclease V subunit gamma [Ectothiorhodospiraceae bacterium 2226]